MIYLSCLFIFFFFNDTATTEIYTTDTLFPYTTLFRSTARPGAKDAQASSRGAQRWCLDWPASATTRTVLPCSFRWRGGDRHQVRCGFGPLRPLRDRHRQSPRQQIGRASCRERVCQYV